MASLRRVSKARGHTHRERSQPADRQHLGFLEKKQDYKLRAKDFQTKRDELSRLHKKALDKNPDEFYFHMIRSKIRDGEHFDLEEKKDENSSAQKILMFNQNLRYVRFKLQMEKKKIEKLRASLHLLDCEKGQNAANSNKHTFFVDSKEDVFSFDAAKRFQTHPGLLGRAQNRPKLDQIRTGPVFFDKTAEKLRKRQYEELKKRIAREKELRIVVAKLEAKRNLAQSSGEKPRKIRRGTSKKAPVYVWPMERKR